MKLSRLLKIAVLGLPVLLAAPAFAGPEAALVERYPVKSITSVARADEALEAVRPVRTEIEQRYLDEQAACYDRFLVSSCLADAKDKRRKSLQAVRRVEVEARAFLRKDKADERDRAVAERQARAAEGGKVIPFSGSRREGADADEAGGADNAKAVNDTNNVTPVPSEAR